MRHVTVDCSDPFGLAGFWAEVLGGTLADDDGPGDPEATVTSAGVELLFVAVPDSKVMKNRLHLDLQPTDRTRDAEVERVISLGAVMVADRREAGGGGWVTLTDVEGNEFCVVRSAAERLP